MKSFPAIALLLASMLLPFVARAEDNGGIMMEALSRVIPGSVEGQVEYAPDGTMTGTNILVKDKNSVLWADSASLNSQTGDVYADGNVRIESGEMLWVGDHIHYNFKTRQMSSEQFRTGRIPLFAGGQNLVGDVSTTNRVFTATNAFVTTDDISDPAVRIRASRIRVIPGQSVEMWNAVLIAHGVPIFYFPYYHRAIGKHANHFTFRPGFDSAFGPYLLSTYNWYLGDEADGKIHANYMFKRGPGIGPDVNLHMKQWGELNFQYYYVHDDRPNTSTNNLPLFKDIPHNRQRFLTTWQATPATNLNIKAQVNYDSDPLVLHDFFPGDYSANPQPNTFFEVNKYSDNWSLDALSTPQVNNYFDQVERLPDIQLTGFRQQVLNTPLYYDSQSSVGYYRDFFAETNVAGIANDNTNYSAARVDTYHQITLPWTFFDWLNLAPRVGGRFTYYSAANGPNVNYAETYRTVLNTGMRASFKLSRTWTGATNSLLDVDGLRHIMEPSADYVFVPNPSTPPAQLPQFDSALPGLMLSPVDFPDYNSIDSVDAQNVIRFGFRNTLQTKRDGQIQNLVDWNLLLDWRLVPNRTQSTFNDLYSALSFQPRTWLNLQSQIRYQPDGSELNMAFHQIEFMPNDRWSWGLGHWYLRSNFPIMGNPGNNYITSTFFYRVDENWALRATHDFNAQEGRLQQQAYTLYRDLRSWTAALTFRITDNSTGPEDYTIAFAFSIKAEPSTHVGDDTVRPDNLLNNDF